MIDRVGRVIAIGIALLIALPAGAARRRAVSPGSPLPTITGQPDLVLPITPSSTMTLTNHGSTATVTLCALSPAAPGKATGCMTNTLATGASAQASAANLHVTQPTVGYITSTNTGGGIVYVEARAEARLAVKSSTLATATNVSSTLLGPSDHTAAAPRIALYTTQASVDGKVILHERYGVIIDTYQFSLPGYAYIEQPLYGPGGMFLATPQDDMRIEIIGNSGNRGAHLTTSAGITLTQYDRFAPTLYFLPNATENTSVQLHTTSVLSNNGIVIKYLTPGDATIARPEAVILLSLDQVRTMPNVLTGALGQPKGTTGNLQLQSLFSPPAAFLLTATEGTRAIPTPTRDDAAISKSASFSNQNDPIRDASINGLTDSDEVQLLNISSWGLLGGGAGGTLIGITGTLTIIDAAGTILATKPIALNPYNTVRFTINDLTGKPVSNVRAYLHLDNDKDQGQVVPPTALLTARTPNGTATSFTFTAPPARTTGEQVVTRYLDILHQQYYYLDNRTVRCMLNGNCNVPSIKSELAAIYSRGIGETWNIETFVQWLTTMSNGITNVTDLELWEKNDPYQWNASGGTGYVLTTSQQTPTREPGSMRLTPTDTQLLWQLNRDFLRQLIDAHPEWYGGNTFTGPSLEPGYYTFLSYDPNDGSGITPLTYYVARQYVSQWLDTLLQNQQQFYLSNREVRCMIIGNCAVPSIAVQLGNALGPATGNTSLVIQDLLGRWTDGDVTNQELYAGFDPLTITSQAPTRVRVYFAPDGTRVSDFNVDGSTIAQVALTVRNFLIDLTYMHPDWYGGNSTTGPNLSFNPTWSTQDPN